MDSKLIKLIQIFLVSLAIGAIVYGSIGYFKPITKYYYVGVNGKSEVLFLEYNEATKSGNDYDYTKETHINSDLALSTGLITYGVCFLVLFGIGAIKKRNY